MATRINITGERYCRLNVMGRDPQRHMHWLCRCDCGETVSVLQGNLRRGNSKSCGCLKREKNGERIRHLRQRRKYPDLSGRRFGHLTAIERKPEGRRTWVCRCVCGTQVRVAACDLNSGNTTSCGCVKRIRGLLKTTFSREYQSWQAIVDGGEKVERPAGGFRSAVVVG